MCPSYTENQKCGMMEEGIYLSNIENNLLHAFVV